MTTLLFTTEIEKYHKELVEAYYLLSKHFQSLGPVYTPRHTEISTAMEELINLIARINSSTVIMK